MGKIGDVYYVVGLDTKGIPQLAKKEGAKAGDTFGKSFGARMKAGLGKTFSGGGGLLGALGIGLGIGAATVAIGKLVDVMGDAVAAAIEEEKSIAKLDAALRANVEGYDGNTDAIEKTLAARMRLGFADDEQRESLALLVGATKDYNKALKIQRVAMDLARFKGISLQAASEALIKVEAGQFRILKSLGIQLPKNASATEALAAVQKVAAGQAEAFAESSEGKLLASQIKVGEAMEKLGTEIMPLVVEGTVALADAVVALAEALADSEDELNVVMELLGLIASQGRSGMTTYSEHTERELKKVTEAHERSAASIEGGLRSVRGDLGDTEDSLDDLGAGSEDVAELVAASMDRMRDAGRDLKDAWLANALQLVSDYFDPIEARSEQLANKQEIAALRATIASKESTKEQIADAKRRLVEISRSNLELFLELAASGKVSRKEITTTLNAWTKKWHSSTGAAKKDLQAIVRQLVLVKLAAMQASGALDFSDQRDFRGAASGGPVPSGVPVWVGEAGKELIVPSVDSTVIPHTQSMQMASTGGVGGNTYQVQLLDRMPVSSVRDIGSGLRMLGEMGYLPGSRK